ncbi:MAG: Eco57I restriction-modification methylase [Candidatus Cloacimonetes bacterium ADurb.Bin088]|jgi:hypothetical protein|nr:MAG: Eco57I restriction-modification methylase [Candidatus Cloacimonetes bacterium ADurb.Bin088]
MELNQNIVTTANFSPENWIAYFDTSSDKYSQNRVRLRRHIDVDFPSVYTLGALEFEDGTACGLFLLQVGRSLTERSSRRKQFDKATDIIRQESVQAGIFIFHDATHSFRLSLVYPVYKGTKRTFSNYRRHSFYVSGDLSNKTYLLQLSKHKLNSMGDLKDIFSVEKVSALFYEEFEREYARLKTGIKNTFNKDITDSLRADFALLFVIRIIFLGFVQKKGWLGKNAGFIRDYLASYDKKTHKQGIYQDLLTPLFFNALNSAPSSKNKHGFPSIPEPFKSHLVSAPYLNGGLFRRHEDYDTAALYITDKAVSDFVTFLFSFNFTLEENTLYDEELELNPEFLGIIFEKLVNKEHGAIYTPRLEVDFMCRLSLVKYLQQNCLASISLENLYKLFFPEYGSEDDQTPGEFTNAEAQDLLDKLETVTVCDPAIGSGAFAVGMLNVIDEIECSIHRHFLPDKTDSSPYERKKRIIFRSLYGVEVKQWAVWITQLRLWITLLIEADDSLQSSDEPLLPSFDFKIRQGDSLIQMLGSTLFPVSGEGVIGPDTKRRIDDLMKLKKDYFFNRCPQKLHEIELKHKALYTSILDSKKKDLLKKLSKLRDVATPEVQDDIFGTDIQAEIEFESGRQKRQIKELELQIWKVDQEISQINTKNLPFVWRIDFPEIFIEKGGFDIVIGNPPYLQSGNISDPLGKISKDKYKELLRKMAELDFPNDISEKSIDGRSDLYTFFYVRGLKLLNPRGYLTYICSNSWLDVEFGYWLQRLVIGKCILHYLINNQAQRSFKRADVNTIISIMGPSNSKGKSSHKNKFITFKLPFEECIYTENLLLMSEAEKLIDYSDVRINPVTLEEIALNELELIGNEEDPLISSSFCGTKLGSLYLIAPKVYWDVFIEKKKYLQPLKSFFDYKRGLTTNCVKFFFVDKDKSDFMIEDQYLTPIITSSQRIKRLQFDNDKYLFSCNKSKTSLKGTNALKYIENWEKQAKLAKFDSKWYSVEHEKASFLLFRFWDKRFFTPAPTADMIASDNFFIGYNLKYDKEAILAIMNSTFYFWQIEIMGRKNQGQGILNTYGPDYEYVRLPDLALFDIDKLKQAYRTLCLRDIYDYRNEVMQPDKQHLDRIVFDALGLTESERQEIIRSFLSLVGLRISKASSLKTKNQNR